MDINGVQCNDEIINNLKSLVLNKYSFIHYLEITFTDNKKIKNYELNEKCLENMINCIVNNNILFDECIECIKNTLLYIGYAIDVVKIIINYIYYDDTMNIELLGLQNKFKVNSKNYFEQCMKIAKETNNKMSNIKRQIKFNDF